MEIHRIATQGETINEVIVTEDDEFDLVLTVYDDEGAALTDGQGILCIVTMSDGSYARWTSSQGIVSAGEATVSFDSNATIEPGDYICRVAVWDDAATPEAQLVMGEFKFVVQEGI